MKAILFMITLSVVSLFYPKERIYTVSGTITYNGPYCGGAEPDEQTLQFYARVKPYPGKMLFIKKGTTNTSRQAVADTIVSDADGRFSLELPAGEYCIIQVPQLNREILNRYSTDENDMLFVSDPLCLEKWWDECLLSFTVTDRDVDSLNLHFHQPCFIPEGIPCLIYNGPYPP
jgi:hypothetical protein